MTMAFKGTMPAVDLVAPTFGLEAGATVVRHGDSEQTWGAGFEQENGLCGIHGEFWTWCGAGLPSNQYPAVGADGADIADMASVSDLTSSDSEGLGRWEQVYPFLVQAEDLCNGPLSVRRPEAQDHLLEVLEFLSIKGAERELWTGTSNEDAKALNRDATMIATGLPVKVGLAVVEEAMAECLPGVEGTIHITPSVAVILENCLHEEDGKLFTFTGSRVIVGAGYAGQESVHGTAFDHTKSAIYGTGPVIAHLGPTSMITTELAQMSAIAVTGRNEFALRAERLAAVTFDGCCHVGATVTLT